MAEITDDYNLYLGPNRILNVPNPFEVIGKGKNQQPILFRQTEDGKIQINVKIKNNQNHTILRISKGKTVYNDPSIVVEDTNPIIITDFNTSQEILRIEKKGRNDFYITGHFILEGVDVIATNTTLSIGGVDVTIKNKDLDITFNALFGSPIKNKLVKK